MNIIGVFKALGPIDWRNIRRDSLLVWMALMPLFFLLIFRFGMPAVRDIIFARFGFDLAMYYGLLLGYGFVVGIPTLFGLVIGFLLIDERDDHTLVALQVTPMPLTSYFAYRVTLPIVLSFILTLVTFPLTNLITIPLGHVFWVALLAAPMSPIFALFLAVFSANKVQGFAIMKGSGTVLMLPLAAYFIKGGWQIIFGLIPTYWPLKLFWVLQANSGGGWIYFVAGFSYQIFLLGMLLRYFKQKLH